MLGPPNEINGQLNLTLACLCKNVLQHTGKMDALKNIYENFQSYSLL